LRYQRRVEDADSRQNLEADYSLRAASRLMGSDFVYVRQHWQARYTLTRGKHTVSDTVQIGLITGHPPLFERYVAGNSALLRGWNKYEIDPLGGNRIVHNSVDYRYSVFQVFYDTGSVWDGGQTAIVRHSVGAGVRQGPFFIAVACPMRQHRLEPIVMVGMNY
jgi:outer membrane protein assembly factor BamA